MQQTESMPRHRRPHPATTRLVSLTLLATLVALFLLALAPAQAAPTAQDAPAAPAAWTVVANGLANPRHLTFGPDGALYVAEAGAGGDGLCITGPEGDPICYGASGAVTQVEFDAAMAPTGQAQLITGLPSLGNEGTGGNATGVNGLAFNGEDLYLVTGLGANPIIRDPGGALETVGANFAQLMAAGPGDSFTNWVDLGDYERDENPAEDQIDTNPFDLTRISGGYLVVDAGGNSLLQVTDGGVISTVATFPARMVEGPTGEMMPMDAVPTSVTVGPDGAYYVTQLTGFPFPVGGANVWRVAPGSDPEIYAGGFTNILDAAFAADGSLYVLEMFRNSMLSGNPTGAVTRVWPDGRRAVVAREGLITPTGLTIGPDHALYVSNFGTSADAGQVVRIPTALSEATQFSAWLSGDEETPPVETPASGVARFTLADEGMLSYEIAVRAIGEAEPITAAHIHEGAPGESGPPIFTLFPNGDADFDPENPLMGTVDLTDEQVATLLAGNYYVNVHTGDFPAGEIRGQIYPAHTTAWSAMLSGANEVPHVHSPATGQAYVTLSADMSMLHYRVLVAGIHGVTAAHFHEAPAGENGPVVFPIFSGGPPSFDEHNPVSGMVPVDIKQVAALAAGDHYVNVHTTAYPGGEIRGQVGMATPRAAYHALLSGAEEVPPVDTDGLGVGRYWLSPDLSTLDFYLAVDAIDNLTAAHLHNGFAGTNGPVAITLYGGGGSFAPGSPVSGLAPLTPQQVLDLWTGNYYTNVHSSDHTGGEIRGQTEGASLFGAGLNGDNEVPPNGSAGTGRAVLALSDDATVLYWRVMVSELEHITAAHIHLGLPGEVGPPVITLFAGSPPPFDDENPISGSAMVSDANIFDMLAGRHYVNVHTSHLPNGEIRGQVGARTPQTMFSAHLDGAQEVEPVDTEATGEGHFTLDPRRNVLHHFVSISDIDKVTAAHIHKGPVGVNGPVVFPLYLGGPLPFGPDNPIGGGHALGAENLVDLLTAFYYVNVHTTDHPSGEIRGQIMADAYMAYLPALVND